MRITNINQKKIIKSFLLIFLAIYNSNLVMGSHDPNFTGNEPNIYKTGESPDGKTVNILGDMHFTNDNNIIYFTGKQSNPYPAILNYNSNGVQTTITNDADTLFLKGRVTEPNEGNASGYHQYTNKNAYVVFDTKLDIDLVLKMKPFYYDNSGLRFNAHSYDTDPDKFVNKTTFNKSVNVYVENAVAVDPKNKEGNEAILTGIFGQATGVARNEITFKDKLNLVINNSKDTNRDVSGIHIQDQNGFADSPSNYTFENDVKIIANNKKGSVIGFDCLGYKGANAIYHFKKNFNADLTNESETGTGYGIFLSSVQGNKPSGNSLEQNKSGHVKAIFDGKVNIDLNTKKEKPIAIRSYNKGGISEIILNDTLTVIGNPDITVAESYSRKGDFESKSIISLNGSNNLSASTLFNSTGENSLVEVNKLGGKTQNLKGAVYSSYDGTVDINIDTPDSKIALDIINYKKYDENYNWIENLNKKSNNEMSGHTNIGVSNQAIWNVTNFKDKILMIDTLKNSNNGVVNLSTVDFTDKFAQPSLIVKDLIGTDGIIKLDTDVVNNKGQYLRILNSSEGNHKLDINNAPSVGVTDPYAPIKVIDSAELENNFQANFTSLHPVEVGPYVYNVGNLETVKKSLYINKFTNFKDEDKNDWYLYPEKIGDEPKKTPTANGGMISISSNYLGALAELQTLRQRLGDIHHFNLYQEKTSPWFKIFGGHYKSEKEHKVPIMNYYYGGLQLGIDRRYDEDNGNTKLYRGFYASLLSGDSEYKEGYINSKQYSIGYYHSKNNKNKYNDYIIQIGHINNDLKTVDTANNSVLIKDLCTNFVSFSGEIGKRYEIKNNKNNSVIEYSKTDKDKRLFIEPQAQLTFTHFFGNSFSTNNGLHAKSNGFNSLLGRLGFIIEKTHNNKNEKVGSYYGKFMYEKEFLAKGTYIYNDLNEVTADYRDGHFIIGLGANYSIKDKYQLYGEIECSTSSNTFKKVFGFNLGAKLKF